MKSRCLRDYNSRSQVSVTWGNWKLVLEDETFIVISPRSQPLVMRKVRIVSGSNFKCQGTGYQHSILELCMWRILGPHN
jgi:hypothetical protein